MHWASGSRKKKRIDHGSSPKGDGYATDNEDSGQTAGQDLADLDPALGPGTLESAGCSSPDDPSSENGSDVTENQCSRRAYVPPSIMGHRKKVHIKSERQSRDACGGLFGAEHAVNDSDENSHNPT